MKSRCLNPKSQQYHNYGGRGIKVCDRWQRFENFYADMGDRPSAQHTLDRRDNDRGYEPGNCEWRTYTQQNNNTRRSHRLTHNGETHTIAEWAAILGVPKQRLVNRITTYGWSAERALTEPAHR